MHRPLIVLKFGGSVLAAPERLSLAVHETYRRTRAGYAVVAVVSAFGGRTDALAARAAAFNDAPASATAALLGLGENESAALLALALNEAGVRAEVLDEAAIGLRAEGPALDANPVGVDVAALRGGFRESDVLVVPGFVGRDARGRRVLLGRGGSDLTALFLAERLGADRCRLIKDVDGLFEWDPARPGPAPRKYASLDWTAALRLDGSILQHKAIRFAQAANLAFEVAAFNSRRPTHIGNLPTRFAAPAPSLPPLRVALLGAGTVGLGVLRRLERLPDYFRTSAVAVRDAASAAERGVPRHLLTTDVEAPAAEGRADVVVECLGGITPADAAIRGALRAGVHVVSANKAVIAARFAGFQEAAERGGATLRYSAAVGGAAPVLEAVARASAGAGVRSVRAVLNGTSSFVLSRFAAGESWEDAVAEAQRRGLAEADPSRDLDGRDAADKLCLIARAAGWALGPEEIAREGIDAQSAARPRLAQVAELNLRGGRCTARVTLASLDPGDPLESLGPVGCGALIEDRDGVHTFVAGTGAGRWPTAEAVVADLLELARERSAVCEFVNTDGVVPVAGDAA